MSDQEVGREGLVQGVISQLEEISGNTVEEDAFVFSNDRGIEEYIPEIIESVSESKSRFKVAVMVSNGGLWNLGKELDDVDLILRINLNKNQIKLDKQRVEEILLASSVDDLLPQPNSGVDEEDFLAVKHERERLEAVETEKRSYGRYSYLRGSEMLEKTKTFLRQNKIAFIGGNLTNRDQMGKIAKVLKEHDGQIVFADLSNVMGGEGGQRNERSKEEFIEKLKVLPFSEDCAILHSAHTGRAGRSPIDSKLSIGLDQYSEDSVKIRTSGTVTLGR